MKPHRRLYLVLLILAAFALKFLLLQKRGPCLEYDESYYILLARSLFSGRGYTLNGLPHGAFPPLLPFLIGGLTLFTRNEILSLRLLSALAGSLLLLPVYLIAGRMTSERGACLTILWLLLLPPLNDFLNVNRSYFDLLYAGSEPLYLLLLVTFLYLGFRALRSHLPLFAGLAAAFLAAAFLVRPEAILFLPFMVLAFFLWGEIRRVSPRFLQTGSVFIAVFLFLSFPYFLYLRYHSGRWLISSKLETGQAYQRGMYEVIEKDEWLPFCRFRYALDRAGEGMKSLYWGLSKRPPETTAAGGNWVWILPARIRKNISFFFPEVFLRIFPAWLYPLTILGMAAYLFRFPSLGSAAAGGGFLIFMLLPQLLVGLLMYPLPRHQLLLSVIFTVFAGIGCECLIRWLSGRFPPLRTEYVAGVIGLVLFWQLSRQLESGRAGGEKRVACELNRQLAGQLRGLGSPEDIVMSWDPAPAVLAGRDWRVLPYDSEERIIRYARKLGVDYIVFSRRAGFRHDEYFKNMLSDIEYKIVRVGKTTAD